MFNDPYLGQIDPIIYLTLSTSILNLTDGSFIGVIGSDISTDFIYQEIQRSLSLGVSEV